LEKFAEIERRVRKLLVYERSLRDEVSSLEGRLSEAQARAESLEQELETERASRLKVQERVDSLINWLEGLEKGTESVDANEDNSSADSSGSSDYAASGKEADQN